uniref:LAGLIDADG endonuclease n=1 Tax=Ramaria rubella TaxID=113071 RepID=UPI0022380093|nr:LAGLIDADG endonuclease [Ramaria rubella]UYR22222.1 LAGLIDADG endonuclease [Ramaria rubella]
MLPWQITGLTDGDGSFSISLVKTKSRLLVVPKYVMVAAKSPENHKMLMNMKSFFGDIGFITTFKDIYLYNVVGLHNGLIIKEHFKNYPLMTYKLVYFNLWSNVLDIIQTGDHLTELHKIISIKAAFKKGLNKNLSKEYSNVQPIINQVMLLL